MKKNAPQFQLVSAKSKKSKLASIFDKLESSNAAFLAAAAQSSLATELARVKSAPNPAPIDNVRQHNPLTGKLGLNANELAKRAERRERFLAEQAAEASSAGMSSSSATLVQVREAQGHAARGLNTNLEKAYLRLTSLPSVADVRPPKVLAQALALVREKWKEGVSYKYACDQLKSIRQDLTVQHVRSALTVAVYETHSRIAIEVGDWAELRQSLAVLKGLYAELTHKAQQPRGEGTAQNELLHAKLGKKKKKKLSHGGGVSPGSMDDATANELEFMSYSLMLAAATGRDVLAFELQETAGRGLLDREDEFMSIALTACCALGTGNYVQLLKCYQSAPRMAPYLLDLLVERMRPKAWVTLLAAFGGPGGLALIDVAAWLGFGEVGAAGAWVRERGGVVASDGTVDVKASRAGLRQVEQGGANGSKLTLNTSKRQVLSCTPQEFSQHSNYP